MYRYTCTCMYLSTSYSDVCFQLKRRHVLASIVDSETSYLESLRRLVKDYERPLVDAKPQILSKNTIRVIFYKMNDILQVHYSLYNGLS